MNTRRYRLIAPMLTLLIAAAAGTATANTSSVDELETKHRARAQAADGHRHPVATVGVEPRLRTIVGISDDDRSLRCAGKT